MAYLDAATDRLARKYDAQVHAIRAGTIFAHDQKAYAKWQRAGRKGTGLSGAALENAVMGLARRNPEYVVVGP